MSFVCQYDVELVHSIEALIGHQLEEHKMDEAEVLKGITKVRGGGGGGLQGLEHPHRRVWRLRGALLHEQILG